MPDIPLENVTAAFPPSAVLPGGKRLPPMTLQHVLALRAMGSPIMAEGARRDIPLDDAILAVAIFLAEPGDLADLISRAAMDKTCGNVGMDLTPAMRQDMLEARRELHALGAKLAADIPIDQLNAFVQQLVRQVESAFATLVPLREDDGATPFVQGRTGRAPAAGAGRSSSPTRSCRATASPGKPRSTRRS